MALVELFFFTPTPETAYFPIRQQHFTEPLEMKNKLSVHIYLKFEFISITTAFIVFIFRQLGDKRQMCT